VILLGFARLDPRHVWTGVDGDLAVVGATVDQAADAAPEPFEEGIEINYCHNVFSLS